MHVLLLCFAKYSSTQYNCCSCALQTLSLLLLHEKSFTTVLLCSHNVHQLHLANVLVCTSCVLLFLSWAQCARLLLGPNTHCFCGAWCALLGPMYNTFARLDTLYLCQAQCTMPLLGLIRITFARPNVHQLPCVRLLAVNWMRAWPPPDNLLGLGLEIQVGADLKAHNLQI